ncbi:MAG: dockerin type I repeat-containing protein, partial [Bacteroidaceae bacterium]|nr:dockerin type I repeat-containing protein [Bacteroidaceae bacterium]
LTTIYCKDDWSGTEAQSGLMFFNCKSLVGGSGTTYNEDFKDATYARPDGGPRAPGYFTIHGDLNGDKKVDIADAVTVLNIMAASEFNAEADLNGDQKIDIADFVTVLNIMARQ